MGVRNSARGLDAVLRHPTPRERPYLTPSGATALLQCKLKVAFGSEPSHGIRAGSPATRLGTICHRVLESAARRRLGPGDAAGWAAAFEAAWGNAVAEQQSELAGLALPRAWPPPERWPFYAQRKVATKRVARALSTEVHAEGFAGAAEDEQVSANGLIRGMPDLVVREPMHEVRDYKTGRVAEEDGAVRADYALQVQLYAVLERDTVGDWPTRGILIPLPGEPALVDVSPAAADEAADATVAALARYNEAAATGDASGLGSPSTAACKYCEYAPKCTAFWSAWEASWVDAGLAASAGTVVDVRRALRGGISVEMDVDRGCSEDGRLTVHELDAETMPQLLDLAPGDPVVFVGLYLRGPGHALPAYQARIATRDAEAPRADE